MRPKTLAFFKNTKPETIEMNIRAVVSILCELGESNYKQIAGRLGRTTSWAGAYMREAERRGLVVRTKSRPVMFILPDQASRHKMKPDHFKETGEKINISVYLDSSYCVKLEALSQAYFGVRHGGQSKVVQRLIDAEVDRLKAKGQDLAKLAEIFVKYDEELGKAGFGDA
jgi:hypothetical protein